MVKLKEEAKAKDTAMPTIGKDAIAKESQGFVDALGQHVFDYGQEAYKQSKDMNKKGDPRKGSMYLFRQHVWMNQEMKNWDGTPV